MVRRTHAPIRPGDKKIKKQRIKAVEREANKQIISDAQNEFTNLLNIEDDEEQNEENKNSTVNENNSMRDEDDQIDNNQKTTNDSGTINSSNSNNATDDNTNDNKLDANPRQRHKTEYKALRADIEALKKSRLKFHRRTEATTGGIRAVNVSAKEQRKSLTNEIKKLEVEFKQRTEREIKLWEMKQKNKNETSTVNNNDENNNNDNSEENVRKPAESANEELSMKPFVMNFS